MDKNLQYWSASGVNIFYLLWSNVFSLCQFENILLPVNDFQSSILYEADKSTCVEALVMVSVGRRERHWYCPYLKWFLWSSLFLFLGFGEMKSGFHKACLQKANQQASGKVPGGCWVMQMAASFSEDMLQLSVSNNLFPTPPSQELWERRSYLLLKLLNDSALPGMFTSC